MKRTRKTITRTTTPGLFTCWKCAGDLPVECFTASALKYNGECKDCRKKTNSGYWPRYKAALDAFEQGAT